MIARLALGGALIVAVLGVPGQALAVNPPVATCSGAGGSSSCGGWFRSDVSITWSVDPGWQSVSCDGTPVTADGAAISRECTATYPGNVTVSKTVMINRDATPPQIAAATPARSPDANGWYNHAVAVSFSGSDATSGLAGCSQPSYSGPDGADGSVTGSCQDVAGNVTNGTLSLHYDATPPTASLAADRRPDRNGWYVKPVTVTATGTDATSGLAGCSAPLAYKGPDTAKASFSGSCRDNAGNSANANPLELKYDSTPPKVTLLQPIWKVRKTTVRWKVAGADVVQIDRSPGINRHARTTVYRGKGSSFTDRTVKDSIRYRYVVRAIDAAGNAASATLITSYAGPALQQPAAGAVVHKPPRLVWAKVKGAHFYNAQLFNHGVKILSVWPRSPSLQLSRRWTYAGRVRRLDPGTYKWIVWAAFGTPAKPRYGKALGTSTFVVKS